MSGDSYKRRFSGNVAQCGCRWIQAPEGDRLLECLFHAEATKANVERFEATRKIKGHRYDHVIVDEPRALDLRVKEALMRQGSEVNSDPSFPDRKSSPLRMQEESQDK